MAARKSPDAEQDAAVPAASDEPAVESAGKDAAEAATHLSASAHLIGTSDTALAAYFTAFTRYASPEDLVRYSGAELAALVKQVYEQTAQRVPGASLVVHFVPRERAQVFSRSESVVVAVNDDMPFLYDSCTAEVLAQGHQIRAAFHPVIPTRRDASGLRAGDGAIVSESIIVLALEHLSDESDIARLTKGLRDVFADVRAVVRDWKPILHRIAETTAELKRQPPPIPEEELNESLAFLHWLGDNNFTFLGARDYVFRADGEGRLRADLQTGLGVLADPELHVVRRGTDPSGLTPEVRDFLTQPSPLIIAKANSRSTVHRRAHMDYVGVKRFDENGTLLGERRFVGLFTSSAYSKLPSDIPLLRRKVAQVLAGSGLLADSHDGKALAHVLNSYPRDELFQISEAELLVTTLGILNLGQRPKVRVFLRFDKFDRFVSALVFVPRERYNTSVREKIHAILARTFDGRMSAAYPNLDQDALARVHFIIGRNAGPRPQADLKELENEIRDAISTWQDSFSEAVLARNGEVAGGKLARRYAGAFPAAYRDSFTPAQAVDDIPRVEQLLEGEAPGGRLSAHLEPRADIEQDGRALLHLKLFVRGDYVPLSDCLPLFENMGLRVIAEDAYPLMPLADNGQQERAALQYFLLERAGDMQGRDPASLKPLLEDAFHAIWLGYAESDGFNRLVVEAELNWRDATILRAIAKFLRQAGITFSQAYMETALARNPALSVLLVDLFYARHEPGAYANAKLREKDAAAIRQRIEAALEDVLSADEDRIIRSFAAVIEAMLRTNFFQSESGAARPALAFKLASRTLDLVPAPKPFAEIFVYAPAVEGVHLRFGPVARGGIRWSDRAEDFRTEILGLVKAQQVKNAVIVPVGAKGGFYPKLLPKYGPREAVQDAGIAAYKIFIGALLDITDNIGPDGAIQPPRDVTRHDGDDPYLVVAADKGTASFSDIANEIALARGFWLGDAFASGGSHGYNHKTMGITARGAWEAVKRHFRELGRDIQTQSFTAIGVGDMSGDVFGNAMLLSRATKLIAAFDHRHIFFDPQPDPEKSWAERKRLFALPRSSWSDYDPAVISQGGGVFPRTAKEISVSKEMRAVTGIQKLSVTPQELMRALLTAQVDLLFFGGIGTFVKSVSETAAEVGDRANDAVRVNGREVRAAVIGEGANLGVTQLGRAEYAREGGAAHDGGRINSDAIDNSAGVDTSDHEVNLKILMSAPARRGELDAARRDSLLAAMTDDVARLVLQDNYDQTWAISVAETSAPSDVDASSRFMREMERSGLLDREVEKLPDDEALRVRAREGKGLTRPEIAVLLAYAKLDLSDALTESKLPDDPYFETLLRAYFPEAAVEGFAKELPHHRLRRDIIATQLVNRTVNLGGPLYIHRMREVSNAPAWCAARAFLLADGVFRFSEVKERIAALDLKVPAEIQNRMLADIVQIVRRLGLWFIVQLPASAGISDTIATYGAGFGAMKGRFSDFVSPLEADMIEERISELTAAGVPRDLAEDVGVLPLLGAAPEIVLLSERHQLPVLVVASAYFKLGALVGFDRLRALSEQVASADHWDRLALRRIVDDLYAAQRVLTGEALGRVGPALRDAAPEKAAAALRDWAETRREEIARTHSFLEELERGGPPTIAKLSLANSQVQKIAIPS